MLSCVTAFLEMASSQLARKGTFLLSAEIRSVLLSFLLNHSKELLS